MPMSQPRYSLAPQAAASSTNSQPNPYERSHNTRVDFQEAKFKVYYEPYPAQEVPPLSHFHKGQFDSMWNSPDPWQTLQEQKAAMDQLRELGLVRIEFLKETDTYRRRGATIYNVHYSREAVVGILGMQTEVPIRLPGREELPAGLVSNHADFSACAAKSTVFVERCCFRDVAPEQDGLRQKQLGSRYPGYPGFDGLPRPVIDNQACKKTSRKVRTNALWSSVIATTLWRLRLEGWVIHTGPLAIQPVTCSAPPTTSTAMGRIC